MLAEIDGSSASAGAGCGARRSRRRGRPAPRTLIDVYVNVIENRFPTHREPAGTVAAMPARARGSLPAMSRRRSPLRSAALRARVRASFARQGAMALIGAALGEVAPGLLRDRARAAARGVAAARLRARGHRRQRSSTPPEATPASRCFPRTLGADGRVQAEPARARRRASASSPRVSSSSRDARS